MRKLVNAINVADSCYDIRIFLIFYTKFTIVYCKFCVENNIFIVFCTIQKIIQKIIIRNNNKVDKVIPTLSLLQ